MSETLRDLVVSLSLQTDDFTPNIAPLYRSVCRLLYCSINESLTDQEGPSCDIIKKI